MSEYNRRPSRTNNAFGSQMRSRINFKRRGTVDDGWGNQVPGGKPVTVFTSACHMRPLGLGSSGTEQLTASMLTGNQPFLVTVRYRKELDNVTIAWTLDDARNPNRIFNVKSEPVDPIGDNRFREFVVIEGQAS